MNTNHLGSFCGLILLLLVAVTIGDVSRGLPVQIAYQDQRCNDDRRDTFLEVLKNGDLRIFGSGAPQDVKRSELARRLEEVFRTRSERVLFIKADSNLPFQSVAEVIDISKPHVSFVALLTPAVEAGLCSRIRVSA
jgi:biopolymer transport protein TolR